MLSGFVDRTNRALQLVEGFMPECCWLDDEQALTYLHSTVSTERRCVRVPEIPWMSDIAPDRLPTRQELRLPIIMVRIIRIPVTPVISETT